MIEDTTTLRGSKTRDGTNRPLRWTSVHKGRTEAHMSRSSAKIANKVARSGRTSTRRISEPPRRTRKKRPATKKRTPKKRTQKKKRAPKKNKRSRTPSRSRGFGRLLMMIVIMMGLGFVSILLIDRWAEGAPREAPREEVVEDTNDDGATLGALVEKFIDRLLDRDLPVERTKVKPKPKAKPVDDVKPALRKEAPKKTDATYKQEAKPLKAARERKKKNRAATKRARIDALLDSVGVPQTQ